MNVTIDIKGNDTGKLAAIMRQLGPGNRRRLHAVAAKDAEVRIRRHIVRLASSRHASASAVGGNPTGHFRKGVHNISRTADDKAGVVTVRIPGITRARHDIDMSAPTRFGKKYFTIAKNAKSYGHTVPWMKSKGWKIFRPGKSLCLLGYKNKGENPILLYTLTTKIHQRKDPSLMPTKGEIYLGATDAMKKEVNAIIERARQ